MKVLKEDCPMSKLIREAEQALRERGVSISHRSDGLLIIVKSGHTEQTFVIRDGESNDIVSVFPTEIEPTKIQRIEHYISGE